ncbi:MAG: hypothetical protein RL223_1749 [Pseudomonadota bacterium]|jgi:phosphatidylserine decarboxylase
MKPPDPAPMNPPLNPPSSSPSPARPSLTTLLKEDLNFLLTNRVPRLALTRAMGRYARIDSPWLTRLSLAVWRCFTDLDLSEAQAPPDGRWRSVRQVFTRALKPGLRPIAADTAVLCSPCDAIVGACGAVQGTTAFQAKGYPYSLNELFGPTQDSTPFHDGEFITLRLTSAMYHRFHAPADLRLEHVTFHSGDTWNVNPIAVRRVERLFCRNERAVLRARLAPGLGGHPIALVPVAAILVASLRLHALDLTLSQGWGGPTELPCDAASRKGEELGWFEHGSTILVFVPKGFTRARGIEPGARIRMGEPLLRLPART